MCTITNEKVFLMSILARTRVTRTKCQHHWKRWKTSQFSMPEPEPEHFSSLGSAFYGTMNWMCAFFGKQRSHPMRSQHLSARSFQSSTELSCISIRQKYINAHRVYFCLEEDIQISDLKKPLKSILTCLFFIFTVRR